MNLSATIQQGRLAKLGHFGFVSPILPAWSRNVAGYVFGDSTHSPDKTLDRDFSVLPACTEREMCGYTPKADQELGNQGGAVMLNSV